MRTKLTEEEKRARKQEYMKRYRAENRDALLAKNRKRAYIYYYEHREEVKYKMSLYRNSEAYKEKNSLYQNGYYKKYKNTKHGRAMHLLDAYLRSDLKKGFDTSQNINAAWMEENIFSGQSCIYCGDSEWEHLGCDRIDNDKPHTPENCIPCCGICNAERSDKFSVEGFKKYRELHPRTLGSTIEKSWEISELPNGLKVIKKKKGGAC